MKIKTLQSDSQSHRHISFNQEVQGSIPCERTKNIYTKSLLSKQAFLLAVANTDPVAEMSPTELRIALRND